MSDYIARQVEERNRAWHQAKELLDNAAAEKRDLTAAEEESYGRIMADMAKRDDVMRSMLEDEKRTREIEDAVRGHVEARPSGPSGHPAIATDAEVLRKLATGELRSHTFEQRALNTTDDSSVVPQGFYDQMAALMTTVGPMLDPSIVNVVTTDGGNDIKWPVESTRPTATAIAEATSIADLDPTFSSITLKSKKVAVLTKVSHEVLADSGVDLAAVLAESIGTSIGIKCNALLTVGTGTVEPNGIVTAAGSGLSGSTAVSGAFTADNLIDLCHSVDSAYIRQGAGWMMRRTSLGAVRKLKDTAGNYLFVPAATVGTPDTILGYPVHDNPDVVAPGSDARSVIFGNFKKYLVRRVGGLELARSEDAYFATDEVGFRATVRIWGDLGQSAAVKYFRGPTA